MRSAVCRRACIVRGASRMQFTTQWRGLNCNAPMLFSLWPAPRIDVLDLVTRYRFPSPRVCQRQIRICRIARVCACVSEEIEIAHTAARIRTNERETLFVIRTQPNDSSARSVLLSIGLICRIVVAFNFFVTLARSLARSQIYRIVQTRAEYSYIYTA